MIWNYNNRKNKHKRKRIKNKIKKCKILKKKIIVLNQAANPIRNSNMSKSNLIIPSKDFKKQNKTIPKENSIRISIPSSLTKLNWKTRIPPKKKWQSLTAITNK